MTDGTTGYVTIRRWSLKEGADEATLVALVRDGIIPAYKTQPGCVRLELLRAAERGTYIAVTYWGDRAAFDAWVGEGGQAWRDAYRTTLERWLEIMSFVDEFAADVLVAG